METIILGSVQYFFKYCLIRLAQETRKFFVFFLGEGGSNSSVFKVFSNFFRIYSIYSIINCIKLDSFSLTHYKTLFMVE